jgi:hypothetical protein
MFISSNTWPSDNNTLKKLILSKNKHYADNNQIQNIDDAKSKLKAAFPSADIII